MARFAVVAVAAELSILTVVPVPEVAAKRWTVGGNKFWNPNVTYTIWAQDKHFYLGDWLCTTTNVSDIPMRKIYVASVPFDMPADRLLNHLLAYGDIEEGP